MLTFENDVLCLNGDWVLTNLKDIDRVTENQIFRLNSKSLKVDGAGIAKLDTSGAYRIVSLIQQMAETSDVTVEYAGFESGDEKLLKLVAERYKERAEMLPAERSIGLVEQIGKSFRENLLQFFDIVGFFGMISQAFLRSLFRPGNMRWRTLWANVQTGGVNALPIVGLLNFLIGIVIAYQSAGLLMQYGANIFIVEIVSISMLREMAPLITAIIVAGRTGSAFAAQIGTMSINQEVDALRTIGISPVEQLVLPKMLAMMISLPLLTVFADIMSVFGGMLLARIFLDVSFIEFIDRIPEVITSASLWVGLAKTPAFAVIISLTGCYQGFKVSGGADSVGEQTTKAVVQSIFLVIIADAIFSIITRNVSI